MLMSKSADLMLHQARLLYVQSLYVLHVRHCRIDLVRKSCTIEVIQAESLISNVVQCPP